MVDLKAFRRDNNFTQIEAAEYFGCTQGFISQLERGERPVPDSFFDKIIADSSIESGNLTRDELVQDNQSTEAERETVPMSVFKMMYDERKRFDAQRDELLAQQRILIETIQSQTELLKKDVALRENNARCAAAAGSDK